MKTKQADTTLEEGWPLEKGLTCLQCHSSKPPTSIPTTSPDRLALASPENKTTAAAKTVLYLAYGSNLCAKTFLGDRGIRPLSQINVSAPNFELTFNLPGLPYLEPCFANTRPRKIPSVPEKEPPAYSRNATWTKGIYGVVYEVTPEDYATIIKTEGGGGGYTDVLTPCFELPSSPDGAISSKPFLAHTLYAPLLPDEDGDNSFLRRLLRQARRPDPDNAQASLRYLNLLRDGAREHALPDEYQTYLNQLQPYTITTTRQKIGRVLSLIMALPYLFVMMAGNRVFAGKDGRVPRWLYLIAYALSNLLWMAHDNLLKPLFGDGERTELEDGDESRVANRELWKVTSDAGLSGTDGPESEKARLLEAW